MGIRRILLGVALSSVILLSYSLLEPHLLSITSLEVLGPVDAPLKIAHLSDLHLRKVGFLERKVIAALKAEAPDIILITGDTLDSEKSADAAAEFFKDLSAPLGIYSALGNWEHWQNMVAPSQFEKLGIHLLLNETATPRKDLTLYGFDDSNAGQPSRAIASEHNNDNFCISLFHSPEFFDSVKDVCPLALSGHTHGGQVLLPGIGPLWLPRGSGDYVSGWYESDATKMYVSRGLGTSILPIRFLSRPELVFITVSPKPG